MKRTGLFLATALLALAGAASSTAQDSGEFSAHGFDVVRIESEAKLHVPNEIAAEVWKYLSEHYADPSFLEHDGHRFSATFGDEDFSDTYYDVPELQLLEWKSGIRHRSRVVKSGSATRKDGRQLLQIKLNRDDATGLARSEIKYEIDSALLPPGVVNTGSPIALVAAGQRAECAQRITDLGLDPFELRPIVTLEQNRRRVYLADQHGAIFTVSFDDVSCRDWGADLQFYELELEINEIRYTEASEQDRPWMEELQNTIQADILGRFPAITQNQTPKYNKAFEAIEGSSSLPLRRLVAWNLEWDEAWVVLGLCAAGSLGGLGFLYKSWRTLRKHAATA